MSTRVVTVMLVALMTMLAGCGGNVDDGSSRGASDPDPTPAAAADDPGSGAESDGTASPDASNDSGGVDQPSTDGVMDGGTDVIVVNDGVFDGGELDVRAVAAAHEAGLREARTFTVVEVLDATAQNQARGDDFRTASTRTSTVDVWNNVALSRLETDNFGVESVREEYVRGGLTYVRDGGFGAATSTLRGYPAEWNITELGGLSGSDDVRSLADVVQFTEVGRETVDGVSVVRYEANSLDAFDQSELGLDPGIEAVDASAVLLVGTDGIVRSMEINVDAVTDQETTISVTTTSTWSDIGSTTVTEPDWVTEARSG